MKCSTVDWQNFWAPGWVRLCWITEPNRSPSNDWSSIGFDWLRQKKRMSCLDSSQLRRGPPPPPPKKKQKNNGVILFSQLSVLRCSLTLISKKTEFFWKFKFTPLHLSLRLDFLPCLNYLFISVCSKTAGTVNFRLLALGLYKFVRGFSRAYNRGAD